MIIVGSGAGGGVAAYVLANAGWKVALFEKGRNPFPSLGKTPLTGSLLGNDEVRRRRYYAFHDPLIEPRTLRTTDADDAVLTEVQGLGVGVGGGTLQYDGDSPRVQRADLALRSTYGEIEGADVQDWPITYDELSTAYDEVETLIGVQGLAGSDPFAEARGAYPMPPGYPSKAGLLLTAGAESLGYHPHPMPMAINSMPWRGRPACVNCGFCNLGCPIHAKGSTGVAAIHPALQTGNLTLLTECCVTGVNTNGSTATGVTYIDAEGKVATMTARHVIVATNAIETPRLLLASANSTWPDGVGNSSGLLGRYLMFHVVFGVIGVFPDEVRSYRGRPITHAMADFTVPDGNPGWVRGGYVELGGSIHPIDEGSSYPWAMHRALMTSGRWRRRIAAASMMGEDVPVLSNRVDLDPSIRDVYGRPAARITSARHAHDQAMVDYWMPRLAEIVTASGAEDSMEMDFAVYDGVPSTRHLLGTARMGVDPAVSVTDPSGRVHGTDNLWIADGSVFPTSTAFNPTLTQQALAWRTAMALVEGYAP